MPAELFRTVTTGHHAPGHRFGAVPISLVTHAAVLIAAITIPLLAADRLPRPPIRLTATIAPMPVVVVPQVPRPRAARAAVLTTGVQGPPLEAPDGVRDETGVVPLPPVPADAGIASTGSGTIEGSFAGTLTEPPPAPMPVKETGPIRVGGRVQSPRKVYHQAPVYPMPALAARVQGTVVLEAVISVTGAIEELRVTKSVALLDQAALDAVRQWRYTPTLLDGVPIRVAMTVQVDFKLGQ